MNTITGSPLPFRIGLKTYLVGYVSIGEWQTFTEFLKQDKLRALQYLLYCSLHRGDPRINRKRIKKLFRHSARKINTLIDIICEISLPKKALEKIKVENVIDDLESERDLKTTYRILSRMHGWTPQHISQLSPAQIFSYLAGGTAGTGIEKMSNLQYQNFRAARGLTMEAN